MENYKDLLKSNIEERNRIKDEIKQLEEDIFKYQNRGDHSSATHCIEKKGYLNANLSKIENEIARLERIIKNDGVDPYAPVPVTNNSPSESSNLPIDNGTIKTSMTIDVSINGTKGKGDNQQTIHDSHSQTVTRTSDIKNNQVVNQQTSVDSNSSRQTITNPKTNRIGTTSRNRNNKRTYRKPQQSPNKTTNFITAREIREKQKMELFISNYKNGKSWVESAKLSNVTSRKASKWYNQGKNNFSNNTRFFYGQINHIETHRFEEDKESSSYHKFDFVAKKTKKDERKKMDLFIDFLKQGHNWEKSAELSKIPSTQADIWYRRGSYNFSQNTSYFYNQAKKLKIAPSLINTNLLKESNENVSSPEIIEVEVIDNVVDVNEDNVIDVEVISEDNAAEETEIIISNENLIDDKKSKMNLILFNLKEGKSLEKASEIAGISIDIVNEWIIKGKNGDIKYIDFYNEYKLFRGNIPDKYFKSSVNNDNKVHYSLGERIEKMDSIHNDFDNVKSLSKNIDEKISQDEFKLRLENLIKKFRLKKEEKVRELEINNKIISSYGYEDCKSIEDFEDKKIQIKGEVKNIDEEIRDAGLKNKHALVYSLQNKKARLKIQLLEINDIINLLSKQETLEQDIKEINDKINDLKKQLDDIQDERKQMDKFLEAYRDSKSCEDAAKAVNIKVQRIVNWIHEGRDRSNFNKIYFYNELNRIKKEKERIRRGEELRKLKRERISKLLIQLRNGKTINQACEIVDVNANDVSRWYDAGRKGDGNVNIDFYNQVNEIESMHVFLANFRKVKSIKKAINITNITQKQFDQWYDGKGDVSENTSWFKEQIDEVESIIYNQKIKKNKVSSSSACSNKISVNNKPKINYYGPKNSFDRKQRENMEKITSEMKKGSSRFEAAEKYNIPSSTIIKWYNQGKEGFSNNTIYFYRNVNLIEPVEHEVEKMNIILSAVKKGKSLKEAAESTNIPIRLVNSWYDNGKHGLNDHTIYFYKQVQIENQKEFNQMGRVLDALNNGMSKYEACKIAEVSVSKLDDWIKQGKSGENRNAEYFVKEFDKLNIIDDYAKFNNRGLNLKLCPQCGEVVDMSQNYCNFCGYQLKIVKKRKQGIFDKLKGLF